jgi:MscS family membrane protein
MDLYTLLFGSRLFSYLVITVIFVLLGIIIANFFKRLQRGALQRKKGGEALGIRLGKLFSFLILGILYLDATGLDVTSILAIGGVGAFAISFAAQDVIKNIFGFILIELERSFRIGDEIKFQKLGVEGKVHSVNWRVTKIETSDGYITMVPNSAFITEVVVNKSMKTKA